MNTVELVTGFVKGTMQINVSEHSQTSTYNLSIPDHCIRLVFSDVEYLPWDNPDNLVSAEAERIVSDVRNNLLLLLFLIGGPANVINVAVFYKQGLKDRVNLCLFVLSLSDGLYLLMSVLFYTEQMVLQFTTGETFGPVFIFLANSNLIALIGIYIVSPFLSTIIAIERCLCVYNPLKFQSLLRTRTMAIIIVMAVLLSLGLFFIICYRYHFGCVYDPVSGEVVTTAIEGAFYRTHKEFIDLLDTVLMGVGLPVIESVVVITTTIMTIVKLRQIVTWRSETSTTAISAREVALTKMLVGNSILFIACLTPVATNRFSWLFFPEVSAGGRQQNFYYCGLWVTDILTFINATFNFFVYYVMGSRYRETFWAMFGRKAKAGQA